MTSAVLGIIGGSGIYELPGIEDVREQRVATPWGEPSDTLRVGRIGATEVVFLPRHGRGHRDRPSTNLHATVVADARPHHKPQTRRRSEARARRPAFTATPRPGRTSADRRLSS